MASADFSQFVVTTANDSACETSPLKVRTLSPHLPATFTGTSGNFGASSLLADSPIFPSLICDSCPSGQGFAYSFLQIPPHDGHPCCSAMCFVVAYAHSGLSPVRSRPWRVNKKQDNKKDVRQRQNHKNDRCALSPVIRQRFSDSQLQKFCYKPENFCIIIQSNFEPLLTKRRKT